MRQLFIPACICLAAWSGSVGPDTTPPIEASATAPIDHFKITGERLQSTTDGTGPSTKFPQLEATTQVASLEQPATTENEPDAVADSADVSSPRALKPEQPADQKPAASTPAADTTKPSTDTLRATVGAKPAGEPEVKAAIPPAPPKRVVHRSKKEICETLAKAAHNNDVPVPFFIRLLFQESRFKAAAVSHAGAQGIAQFMPGTAASVGLDNPFDPLQAIPAAARLLHNLIDDFGNLGLAAAAYNAGPKRIHEWLSKKGQLPEETQGYVKAITGRPAETWKVAAAGHSLTRLPFRAPCKDVAGLYAWHDGKKVPLPPPAPIVHHDVLTAKNKGKHEASSKVKTAEADKTKKAGSGKAAAHTTKLASGKSGAHASKAARQTAKKDIDAIQLAARKHHHKSPAHKREEHKRERVAHQ